MKTIKQYLDELKGITGSDYKTAQAMGIRKECLAMIRKRGNVGDENAIKMAEILKIEPEEILISAAVARSHGDVKKAWEKISRLSGVAGGMLLFFNNLDINGAKSLILCILC